ncbi:MAG TPA: hypothetical protein VFX59_29875 [Polyangiales bacterium]|nr:hypothetical protein [Polyangiales bacterium]
MSLPTRRLAALLIVASACSNSERTEPLAAITSFDCGSSLPDKRGELLRAMQLGGPGGAAWNWDGGALVCEVRISLPCHARPIVTVSAGTHARTAQVSHPSPKTAIAHATIPPALWQAALSRSAQPFAQLQLRARVEGRCTGGDERTFTASDVFNAGFASGE